MKVTDYIADFLAEQGVTTVFGYQGSSIAHMIDSIYRHDRLEFIENRHEQAAAFAAVGYAGANKKLGVALACSGPGAINLLNGIADAYYDSVPCLFITGQVSQKEMKQNPELRQSGFQETDILSMVRPITKYAVTVRFPEQIEEILNHAVQTVYHGRPGPVLIDIPHNIQGAQVELPFPVRIKIDKPAFCPANVNQLIKKINSSKRPVFLIGGGMEQLSYSCQMKLAHHNIPVAVSYRGKNNYDNTLINYCGVVGVYGDRCANWSLKYSDLIICFGSRLDGRQTGGEPLQKNGSTNIAVIDIDRAELDKYPDSYIKISGDANCLAELLADKLETSVCFDKWLKIISGWRKRYPIEKEYKISEGVNPNAFLKHFSMMLDEDSTITVDVGQNQLWTNVSIDIKYNQTLLQSGGLGAMGFALPAAVGAYFAGKNQVVCISGDGGIQMNMQELQTIQEMQIPIKIIVLNNKCLGLIRDYQSKALGKRYAGSVLGFGSPDYKFIARAYQMDYIKITSIKQITELESYIHASKACFIEVDICGLSTACPEPSYGFSIIEQSARLSEDELLRIEEEAYECK